MVGLTNGSSSHLNGSNGHSNGVHKKPETSWGFGTRAIHVGSEPSTETGAVIPPISLSTTFKQNGVGNHLGFEYTRSQNPSRAQLEAMLASIETGGAEALAFASGSAATATVIQSLGSDAHAIAVNDVYGGTWRYMMRVAKDLSGLQIGWVNPEGSAEEVRAALRPNTKLIWLESPTNPLLLLPSLPEISALLSEIYSQPADVIASLNYPPKRPLVLVDNTFMSPYFASPLLPIHLPDGTTTPGADIVLHSITKYINGHSDVCMGALVLPPFSPVHEKLQFLQNAHGAVPSAFDCYLAQRGAKTLQLRMQAAGSSALLLAQTLRDHPAVEEVIYPGLSTHPRHAVAWASLSPHARRWIKRLPGVGPDGAGDFPYSGIVSFRLRNQAQAFKFLETLNIFTLAESLGGVESLAEHPATMTHSSIPEVEREERGITGGLVRMSVGIEDSEDLIQDALSAIEAAVLVGNN
ncbi:Cys/Met metabolism PLP-dependent enzyme-domain-containing protein [Roridomyces roridus]|uniref:cystathionine gamma-lyase n=1 Tax=Roridomyces roridus TaxID=1738132 RepID=A0AAD7CIV1_9AGAR|nr:Cys/Met metabolism PLP-dependent enzyme-domain-containing protein [Roridomyces roridus]